MCSIANCYKQATWLSIPLNAETVQGVLIVKLDLCDRHAEYLLCPNDRPPPSLGHRRKRSCVNPQALALLTTYWLRYTGSR